MGFIRIIDIGYYLTVGIVLANNIGDSQSVETALTTDFRDCSLIGIV